jgi:iron complex outermembrane receptor protein
MVIGLCLSVNTFAQQINVKGLVKDTFGEPVIGANVLVKGTVTGTMEDIST